MTSWNAAADPKTPVASRGLKFLRAFVENPAQVASILPSSSALQRRLTELPCLRNARCVVELGPGTGETTHAILEALPSTARLLCIELVEDFAREVEQIPDERLRVEHGHALQVADLLRQNDLPAPDVVISGIPFSHLTPHEGQQLVYAIHTLLAPGGTFVAYQFRDRICELAAECFGSPETSFVPWNLPPLGVYQWTKTSDVTCEQRTG